MKDLIKVEDMIKKLSTGASNFLIDVLVGLIVLVVGFRIIAWLEKTLKKEHRFSKLDKTAKSFIVSFIIISLKVVLIFIVLTIIGVPTASLITVIGSCAVAVGLALQGGLSNIAGGLMILIFKPFQVGDYIKANDLEGTVKSITMFYTTITTIDNKVIQLPNGNLTNSNITNYNTNPTRRVDLEICVSYDSDIDKVKKVIKSVVDKNEKILKDDRNLIRLMKHDSSSLNFAVRSWVKTEDYWDVYYDLMENIKKSFDENNIEIPFPQMDVHIDK